MRFLGQILKNKLAVFYSNYKSNTEFQPIWWTELVTKYFFSWSTLIKMVGNVAHQKAISTSSLSFFHHWKKLPPIIETGECRFPSLSRE